MRVEGSRGLQQSLVFLLGAQTTLSISCLRVCACYVFEYLLMGTFLSIVAIPCLRDAAAPHSQLKVLLQRRNHNQLPDERGNEKTKYFRLKSSEHVSFRLEDIQVSLCYTNATIAENNMDVRSLTVTEQVGSWTGESYLRAGLLDHKGFPYELVVEYSVQIEKASGSPCFPTKRRDREN